MNSTANRKTFFHELSLNQPNSYFNTNLDSNDSLNTKLKALKQDERPLEFSSPVYNPLTPKLLTVVHTTGSTKTGGLFGLTRSGGTKAHRGLDIQADIGTGVLAAEDGVVVRSEYSQSYGYVIYVNHRGGYQTRYSHLSELSVSKGDIVKKGELIGASGKTGNAQGSNILAHVHFEIRKNKDNVSLTALYNGESKPLDPLPLITRHTLTEKVHFEMPEKDGNHWKIRP